MSKLCVHEALSLSDGHRCAGKSVMVPQWVADSSHPSRSDQQAVAVLVPRRAIAEGLAKHVSEMRGCALGEEVGLGIAGVASITKASRLVFMTYGFFMGVTTKDQLYSKWSAVILDEAHERKADADKIMVQLTAACKARPDFKAIIMSATIDNSVYVNNLKANQVPGNIASMDVPGATFPVKDVWFEREAWDPTKPSAVTELALETIWVYLQETIGNLLVFVSTVGAVHELVQTVSGMMQHDSECQVMALYSALNKAERDEVSEFSNLDKYPRNKGKRMICVSTDVAEAGVTISGKLCCSLLCRLVRICMPGACR